MSLSAELGLFIASNIHDKNIMLIYRNAIKKNSY